MIKVALTGNIGSGKTTVAKIFEVFGIPVFNADVEARKLYTDREVKGKLRLLFSDKIFTANGDVDTKKLASIIFNDKNALQEVNSLIHPMVIKKYDDWCIENSFATYTIHEAAIIFEHNLQDNFDFIINVFAPKNIRLNRVIERDKISGSLVKVRMANQLSDEIKSELSHFVINNDGCNFLIPQVDKIHKRLLSK